jgi:hypothetical protein
VNVAIGSERAVVGSEGVATGPGSAAAHSGSQANVVQHAPPEASARRGRLFYGALGVTAILAEAATLVLWALGKVEWEVVAGVTLISGVVLAALQLTR